jgi:CRP-like cAMP-binding protein
MNDEEALSLLERSMSVLADTPPELTAALFRICTPMRLEKGRHFIRAGERPEYVGFNLNGIFRYYYLDAEGEDSTKGFSTLGKFVISYSALARGRPSYFSIEALTDADILRFRYDEWMRLAEKDPRWYRFFFKLVESVYIMKEMREKSFLHDDAATRYQEFREEYPGLEGKIRLYHVASFLGITPEALSRVRKDLKLI